MENCLFKTSFAGYDFIVLNFDGEKVKRPRVGSNHQPFG